MDLQIVKLKRRTTIQKTNQNIKAVPGKTKVDKSK